MSYFLINIAVFAISVALGWKCPVPTGFVKFAQAMVWIVAFPMCLIGVLLGVNLEVSLKQARFLNQKYFAQITGKATVGIPFFIWSKITGRTNLPTKLFVIFAIVSSVLQVVF